jgi:AcrR family transcriptional regulator
MAVVARKSGKGKSAPARSRPGLTPALIVVEALSIVDESGLEALSMRMLAGRLGVEAMALYHHFPSKEALLTAISRALEEEVTARWDNPPADWRERILLLGRNQIRTILAHPNAVLLMTARTNPGGSGYATFEALLKALADAGLDSKARLSWSRTLISLINGTGAFFVPITVKDGTALLPPDPKLFPFTADAIAVRRKVPADPEGVLERGLRPMIAAIEAEVRAARPRR